MNNSTLIAHLRLLSDVQMQSFEQFLLSPYHNDGKYNKEVLIVFQYLQKNITNDEKIAKEMVWEQCFSSKSYNKKIFDNISSYQLKLLKTFIAIEGYQSKDYNAEFALLRFYRQHRELHLFELLSNKLQESLAEEPISIEKNNWQYQLEWEISQVQSLFNTRDNDLNLQKTINRLDIDYLAKRLELSSTLLLQKLFVLDDNSAHQKLLQQILSLSEQAAFDANYPLIKLYSLCCEVYMADDAHKYEALMALNTYFEEVEDLILFETRKIFGVNIRNFYIYCYNNFNNISDEQIFQIHQKHLQKGYHYQGNSDESQLSTSTFLSINRAALKVSAFEWAHDFISTHRNRILSQQAEEVYHFNLATYHFFKGDFQMASDLIFNLNFESVIYNLHHKTLEIMCLYELQNDLYAARLDAFKMYLHRISKKVLTEAYKNYFNDFVNIMQQLCSANTLSNRARIEKLIQKVNGNNAITERKWLLEQMDKELKKCK